MNFKKSVIVVCISQSFLISACNQAKFTNTDSSPTPTNSNAADAVVGIITTPQSQYTKASGDCASDSSTMLTSCMKCQVPASQVVEPVLSKKASNLLDIMTTACQVSNKFDPIGYAAPTRQEILARISRCTDSLYPDTTTSSGQSAVLNALLDPQNKTMMQKLFSEYFYKPPQSDYFETYFGFNGQEVRQMFCYGGAVPLNHLYPAQYFQSIGTPWDAGIPLVYKQGNTYRDQLRECMHQSDLNPWSPTQPVAKKCKYEQISGPNGAAISQQVQAWIDAGYTIGAEIRNHDICASLTSVSQIENLQGDVLIGAFSCK